MSFFEPEFTYTALPVRVRFGPGIRRDTAAEVERLGRSRAIILSTPRQAEKAEALAANLGRLAAGSLPMAEMHTPVEVTEAALAEVRKLEGDCLIALGGGSAIGLGKALGLRTRLPQIALPTTYAGSEATSVLGQTENGRKTTLRDPRVQPAVILYDAELILSLPQSVTVASALNAMAHAAEGLYAQDRNPVSTLLAREGLAAFHAALPRLLGDPQDLTARGETLYGAWLCGTVLGQVGMALHHKLCHVLGGSFSLPHAETHAVMLPHTIGFNARAAHALLEPLRKILGTRDLGAGLYAFAASLDAPQSLAELGMQEADLDRAADLAMSAPYWNPRPLTRKDILALLRTAFAGEPPARCD